MRAVAFVGNARTHRWAQRMLKLLHAPRRWKSINAAISRHRPTMNEEEPQ
jgi:hypothetical protein